MKNKTTTRFIALFFISLLFNTSKAQVHPEDSIELIRLYHIHCDSGCNLEPDFTQPVSTWEGIVVSNNRVVEIDIKSVGLSGSIPNPDLPYLEHLNMGDNNLTGPIPDFNLPNLKSLYLYKNPLNSPVPNFSNLPKLEGFALFACGLVGTVPDFSNLPELLWFYLDNNELSGVVPNFSNIPKLRDLHIRQNNLEGTIPDFDNLPNLEELYLSVNDLTGEIPMLAQCPNLMEINLGFNDLIGHIPPTFADLSNLTKLILNHNQLGCCYDSSLNNLCTQLDPTYNTNNNISGGNDFIIPWEEFCNISTGICQPDIVCPSDSLVFDSLELVRFYDTHCNIGCTLDWDPAQPVHTWEGINLEYNRVSKIKLNAVGLSGSVPNLKLPYLKYLYLGDNNLTGPIPDFDGLPNLKTIYLFKNPLNTTVPDFSNLPKLYGFSLYECELTGTIPDFSNLPNLEWLYLDNNELNGTIPNFSNLPKLIHLFIRQNNLEGTIPNFNNLPKLEKLSFAVNGLKGNMPDFAHCPDLIELSLAYNKLSGSIPPTIGDLDSLTTLILDNNEFSGTIPSELGNLSKLEWMDLSDNQFTENIPVEFENLDSLKQLRLANNRLIGNIPDFSALYVLHLDRNKFSYEQIEAFYLSNHNINKFEYSPQYHGEVQSHIVALDTTLTLQLSNPLPGNHQNITYQWEKNNAGLSGGKDSTYTINNLQLSDVGEYILKMTDTTRIPDLYIISEPIYVIIPGYDSYGQPVEYNQIMVEFDNEANRIHYENTYLYPNFGYVAKSCNCNRELYLWQFQSDEEALEVFLEVNTKRERIDRRKPKAEGGFNNIFNVGLTAPGEGWTWSGSYSDIYPDSVVVFLLDSGVDTIHWDASPYLFNAAPIDSCYDTLISSGFDYTDTLGIISGDFTDSLGHGTYGFRSIAEGLDDYLNLKVVPLKIFDKKGQGTLFDFVCALYHAIDHDADIIHVSAGYTGQASDILENAVALSKEKGCLLVTAAGNDGADIDTLPQYPAYYAKPFYKEGYNGNDSLIHYNNVISVASINPQDELSAFSNYGDSTAVLSAYGENMSGYSHTGEKVSSSGSSVSAFYVTRELVAEMAKDKNRTYEQIWQDFENNRLRDCPATDSLTETGKCLDISLNEVYGNLRVYLEGAYQTTEQKMRKDLNMRQILPGQISGDSTLNHDLAVQPYNNIPPYYQGNETVPNSFDNYPNEVVDWILVSLRAETTSDTVMERTAAWLLDNGDIQLLRPLLEDIHSAPDSVFVAIEHRNHLCVMSPQKIPVRNVITWDFTAQNGYTTSTTTGQTELEFGVWGMFAGDGQQDGMGSGDINGADKIIWQNDNGKFLLYMMGDYDLNGDTNGEDKAIWQRNNGMFSDVPK